MSDPITAGVAASAAASSASSILSATGFFTVVGAFISGLLAPWAILAVLFILGVLFEYNEARGWTVFVTVVSAIVAYFSFAVPFVTILIYSVSYLAIGLVWSFWRYKRYVSTKVERYKNHDQTTRLRVARELTPSAMLSTITAWVIVWPFSLIENLTGDLLRLIETLVTTVFRSIYNRIYNFAIADLNIDSTEK